jgi:hypothetical protein
MPETKVRPLTHLERVRATYGNASPEYVRALEAEVERPRLPHEVNIQLYWAIVGCRERAEDIERNLPEEDGAPDAPPRRTKGGLTEEDALEWRYTAQVLEDHFQPISPWEG